MSENVLLRYVRGEYIRERDYVAPRRRYDRDPTWTTTRDLPSGRTRIVAYSPYSSVSWSAQWEDTKPGSLSGRIRAIVAAIETAAPELVAKMEQAEREAELKHQKWLVEEDRRRREEDRRRIAESEADSNAELREVIARWADLTSIAQFLAGVQSSAEELPDTERDTVLDRLALAREFVGDLNPLEFFRAWKTPAERYTPRYPDCQEHAGGG
jgi:hypothetical protein